MRKISSIIAAAVLGMVALVGCSGTESGTTGFRTLEEIQSDGTIRIGVFSDKAPFGYVDSAGEYAG